MKRAMLKSMASKAPIDPAYTYEARILKVVDADTLDLSVSLGFRAAIEIRARLFGINAPEVTTPEGKTARDFLRKLLVPGAEVMIKTFRGPEDKYGRWLAKVYYNTVDVNALLVQKGHAVLYLP